MIRRHPGTHQSVGSGQAVEHVDLDSDVVAAEQVLGGITAGWTSTDDRHPQGPRSGAHRLFRVESWNWKYSALIFS